MRPSHLTSCRSCKRIIFETLVKRSRQGLHRLSVPEIKQIGGRAGRYRSAAQTSGRSKEDDPEANTGYVTCFEDVDLPYIKAALNEEPPALKAAGIIPPDSVFQKFAAYFPSSIPFHYVIKRVMELAKVNPLFFLCDASDQIDGTMLLDPVRGLSIADRLTLIAAPISTRHSQSCDIAESLAKCVAKDTAGRLLDIESLPLEVLEKGVSGKKEYLEQLEVLHKAVILYSWLSFRFGGVFTDRTLATHVKELVEERMIRALTEFSSHKQLRKDASLHRQIALQKQLQTHAYILGHAEIAESEEEPSYDEEEQKSGNEKPHTTATSAEDIPHAGQPNWETKHTA